MPLGKIFSKLKTPKFPFKTFLTFSQSAICQMFFNKATKHKFKIWIRPENPEKMHFQVQGRVSKNVGFLHTLSTMLCFKYEWSLFYFLKGKEFFAKRRKKAGIKWWLMKVKLKPNAYNNKARHIWFHRLPRQFLPRDHGSFGHKN